MIGKINDYTPIGLLGQGGYGSVWQVESVDKHKFALKLIAVNKQNKLDAKKQAEMYVKLDHPNIMKAREFFFHKQQKFLVIVLQYCPDGNLCDYIGKLQQDQREFIMKQIVQGLIYLHDEKNIIHRDLKPQNILMMNGIPKIADLGIAKLMKTSGVLTKIGAQSYMAPEVFKQQKYNDLSDIWSLGIIFMELLIGERIFDLVQGISSPALQSSFPSQKLLNQIKQKQYKTLVQKMLKRDHSKRLTAQQVHETLKNFKIEKQNKNKKMDKREKLSNMSEKEMIEFILGDIYFPDLKIIELYNNEITDAGLKILAENGHKFPNLQEFWLPRNKITDEGLQVFIENANNFQNLQKVYLYNNQITDKGMKLLAENGHKFSNLQEFYLGGNQITDVGLKVLAENGRKFLKLQKISLDENQITVIGLKALAKNGRQFPKLQEVSISNDKISQKMKQSLLEQYNLKFKIN